MTMTQRECHVLRALERQLMRDSNLALLADLFAEPVTPARQSRPAGHGVRPTTPRRVRNRRSMLTTILVLAMLLGAAGTGVGAALGLSLLTIGAVVVVLNCVIVLMVRAASRLSRREGAIAAVGPAV